MLQGDSAPARNSKLAAVLTKALIVFVVTIAVGAAIFFTVSAVLHDRFMQRLEDESHEDFKDHLRLIKENQ